MKQQDNRPQSVQAQPEQPHRRLHCKRRENQREQPKFTAPTEPVINIDGHIHTGSAVAPWAWI